MAQKGRSGMQIMLVVIVVLSLVVFAWSYHSGGQILRSINRATLIFMILSLPLVIYKSRKEIKSSELNEDEYLLKQVGRADILFLEASNGRLLGWFFLILPVLFALALFLVSHSFEDAIIPSLILVTILWPVAWWTFRTAEKYRRIAEQAGTMFTSSKIHRVPPSKTPSAK